MKLLSYTAHGEVRFGALLSGDRVLELSGQYASALDYLEGGDAAFSAVSAAVAQAEAGSPGGAVTALGELTLAPPIPNPRKLFCLAGNYRQHIEEGGGKAEAKEETYPYFFMKPPSTSLVGSGGPVIHPRIAQKIDWEGEFTIVIGKRGKHISVEDGYDYVAGYTILNDISERDLLSKEPPKADRDGNGYFDWLVGKWFDNGAPCGPTFVTRDEVPDPSQLRLITRVNGVVKQDASVGELIFTVPEVVAFISRVVTLEPGDLISTGTPGGVGSSRGEFLHPGDTVEVEIQPMGILTNPVVAED